MVYKIKFDLRPCRREHVAVLRSDVQRVREATAGLRACSGGSSDSPTRIQALVERHFKLKAGRRGSVRQPRLACRSGRPRRCRPTRRTQIGAMISQGAVELPTRQHQAADGREVTGHG